MSKTYRISTSIGLLLVLFIIICRCSSSVADFYALSIYPLISDTLSFVSFTIPFSLQHIAIALIICGAMFILFHAFRKKIKWKNCLRYEATILLWTYIWFYMAWCNNYSRSSILERTATQQCNFDEAQFKSFIDDYVHALNSEWTTDTVNNFAFLEYETKAFYKHTPAQYGLAEPKLWHHPKPMSINRFYSAVGVRGFMAPLFGESCINEDLQAFDYPFVYAHEYSHLLGVSSEAEANWWAFHACISSTNQAVRYSGYKGILPYIMQNAKSTLSEEEYSEWESKIRVEVIADLKSTRQHWAALRSPTLDNIQSTIYDFFLKSNNVSSGMKNYSEVVRLLISIPSVHSKHIH